MVAAIRDDELPAFLDGFFPGSQIVIPVSAFVALYQVLVLLYGWLLWPIILRKDYIGGRWAYGLHNYETKKHLYGVFVVRQGLEGTIFREGTVYFYGGPPERWNKRGSWRSTFAAVSNEELPFFFEMKTLAPPSAAGDGRDVQGVMILDLVRENGVPTEMHGHFYDHRERTTMTGSVEAKKITVCTTKKQVALALELYGSTE